MHRGHPRIERDTDIKPLLKPPITPKTGAATDEKRWITHSPRGQRRQTILCRGSSGCHPASLIASFVHSRTPPPRVNNRLGAMPQWILAQSAICKKGPGPSRMAAAAISCLDLPTWATAPETLASRDGGRAAMAASSPSTTRGSPPIKPCGYPAAIPLRLRSPLPQQRRFWPLHATASFEADLLCL